MALKMNVPKPSISFSITLTKYGQLACNLCHRDPPIGDTGLCYTCAHLPTTNTAAMDFLEK
jgi:hypothetical protein